MVSISIIEELYVQNTIQQKMWRRKFHDLHGDGAACQIIFYHTNICPFF